MKQLTNKKNVKNYKHYTTQYQKEYYKVPMLPVYHINSKKKENALLVSWVDCYKNVSDI